jgi:formyl-CoA transferase
MLGVLLDSHWKLLAPRIGHPELANHPDYATTRARLARRADVNRRVEAWTRDRRVAEVVEALVQAGLPAAPVQSYADAARDPHVRARDMLQDVPQEDGQTAPITGPAAKLSRTPIHVRSGAPALGAQTEEILGELGIDAEQVARLRDARVIR